MQGLHQEASKVAPSVLRCKCLTTGSVGGGKTEKKKKSWPELFASFGPENNPTVVNFKLPPYLTEHEGRRLLIWARCSTSLPLLKVKMFLLLTKNRCKRSNCIFEMFDSKRTASFITIIQSEFSLYFQGSSVVKQWDLKTGCKSSKPASAHFSSVAAGTLFKVFLHLFPPLQGREEDIVGMKVKPLLKETYLEQYLEQKRCT